MKIKIISFLLIILALVSCSKKSSQTYNPLFFHVDSLLLEPAYIDSSMNFAFQAPKDWKTVSADMFEKIRNKLVSHSDSMIVQITPIKIFMNENNSSLCFISVFENSLNPDLLKTQYLSLIKTKFKDNKINANKFAYHNFKVDQLLIMNQKRIIIKLVITSPNNKIFVIDYIIPAEFYQQNLRTVESSIGSLKSIKEEK